MKKNFLLTLFSLVLSISIFYLIFFTYNFFKRHQDNPYLFKSIEDVKFVKFYSKKLHHLRGYNKIKNKKKNNDYIFSIVNDFSNKNNNVLIQGDSWIEQFVEKNNNQSYKEIYDFVSEKKIGLINSGTTSYSPSLMQIQFDILEKDFNIKPNIVVAYIDQTDVGDELCRYKHNRTYDDNHKLVSIKNTSYSRAVFEYTRINNISEIVLSNNSKLIKNFKLTNFFIKYAYKRFVKKIKIINEYGWKNRNIYKCNFLEITNYLQDISSNDLKYFEDRVNDYINFLLQKKYVEKIFIVTFPHYNHLYETDPTKKYNINVSNIIDDLVKNQNKIHHLNFSKLINNKKIIIDSKAYKNDKSHLKEKYYIEIFLKNIKKEVLNSLS